MPTTSATNQAEHSKSTTATGHSQNLPHNQTKTVVDENTAIDDNNQPQSVVHPLTFDKDKSAMAKSPKNSPVKFIIAGVIAIILGAATGYGSYELYARSNGAAFEEPIAKVASDQVQAGDVFGSANVEDFPNQAQGYLEAGGTDGEGTHTLLRPGGPSQSVTLTSSVTDLDKLVGMEVEVWGETFKGQKAAWLMDVGRVKIVKVEGEKPLK